MDIIAHGSVFSGGKRHYDIVKQILPENIVWINITVPLSDVFKEYEKYNDVVIFASGDPLFYGFANTVMRELPQCNVTVYPSFNSLQLLAHRLCMPYHDMHVVSLTGRPWDKFDEALIRGYEMIGVLTDKTHTPLSIVQRMIDYGYDNYTLYIGEKLGNEEEEYITGPIELWKQKDIVTIKAEYPINSLILTRTNTKSLPPGRSGGGFRGGFGIPDTCFHHLNGRTKMITKMPIRLLTLSMLELHDRKSMWDVGFCTGSVSIEAKLQFPHLHITAFEIRNEGEELMTQNSRKFGAPGIETVIGDFLTIDVTEYDTPDAVFIGGHGGRLPEMVDKIAGKLSKDGCIVFNSVSDESRKMFHDSVSKVGMTIVADTLIAIDDNNPIHIMKAKW